MTLRTLWLKGYRLTTAEIIYHMPDYPDLLQTYVWQEMDLAPRFPVLCRFLEFWDRELEGKLHHVRVAASELITPPGLAHVDVSLTLH